MNKLSGWNDTIVALSTPQGIGAIGVIRLSGAQAWTIANRLFPSKDILLQATHTLHVGFLKHNDQVLDEAVVALFKGPRSYTGEDVVELSCHGSPYILEQVINACVTEGARMAKPGEFTQRAFLNGKLDLTQAEAVADLIASNSAAAHHTALHNIRGGFSAVLKDLRDELIQFSALIELELDFSQEDVEFADRTRLYELITHAQAVTGQLIQSFRLGNVIKNGIQVAIIGKPNAGKSTLLNALLNENRAIVSDIAGTTRDTIEEVLNIEGVLFRLIDTAGIRDHTADAIEMIGVEKSREKMRSADLVLYLFDINDTVEEVLSAVKEIEVAGTPYVLLGNKADTLSEALLKEKFSSLDVLFLSAKHVLNIEALKKRLIDAVIAGDLSSEDTIVTNARHYQALQQVAAALSDTKNGMDNGLPGDLLALDIRRCLHFIGEITGEINTEDKLDYIFSKFCIGK